MKKCALILAGGEGKRMNSEKPKPMAEVLKTPMLGWVIGAVSDICEKNICVITGYHKEYIEEYLKTFDFPIDTVEQKERLGTGHAVMMARDFLSKNKGDVVILCGDAPFMDKKTIEDAYREHKETNASATVISAVLDDPTGYGRIVRKDDNSLDRIVEHKEADEQTLKIREINSGGYWFDTEDLLSVLNRITNNNRSNEYYLPDALKLLLNENKRVSVFKSSNEDTVLGANDPAQLEQLNQIALDKGYKSPY